MCTSRSDFRKSYKQDAHDIKQIIHDDKRRIRPSSLTFILSEVFRTVQRLIGCIENGAFCSVQMPSEFCHHPSHVLLETLRANCACVAHKPGVQRYCKRAFGVRFRDRTGKLQGNLPRPVRFRKERVAEGHHCRYFMKGNDRPRAKAGTSSCSAAFEKAYSSDRKRKSSGVLKSAFAIFGNLSG